MGRTEVNRFTPETQTSCVARFINRTTYIGLTVMLSIGILSKIEAGIGSCEKSVTPPLSTSSRESTFSPRLTSEMRKEKIGSASACYPRDVGECIVSFMLRSGNVPYRRLLPSNVRHIACTSSLVRYPVPQKGIVRL